MEMLRIERATRYIRRIRSKRSRPIDTRGTPDNEKEKGTKIDDKDYRATELVKHCVTTSTDIKIEVESVQQEEVEVEVELSRALVVASKGEYEYTDAWPAPKIQHAEEVLIRAHMVGLNPIDWMSVEYNFCLPAFPWITGRELVGKVERVGGNVIRFKPGDIVWTSTYYRDIRSGCFQELVVAPEHTVSPVPDGISLAQAACLGVPALTAAMTLWKWLGLPLPSQTPPPPPSAYGGASEDRPILLVWGGSASTGQFAIQLAVQSGFEVVTVASDQTRKLVQELGARHVVTRTGKTDEEIIAELKRIGGERITHVLDCVGPGTTKLALRVVSKSRPVQFAPLNLFSPLEVPLNVKMHTVEIKQFVLNKESGVYADELNQLLACGKLRMPEVEIIDGGLKGIPEALARLKKGNMKGRKLVAAIA